MQRTQTPCENDRCPSVTTNSVGLQDILLITETDEEQLLMHLERTLPGALPVDLQRLARGLNK